MALSITFIHDIAPDPIRWTLLFLVPGWFSLVFAVSCTLRSFIRSMDQMTEHVGILYETNRHVLDLPDDHMFPHHADRFKKRREKLVDRYGETNPIGDAIDSLNWWAVRSFVAGVTLIAVFSVLNLLYSGG